MTPTTTNAKATPRPLSLNGLKSLLDAPPTTLSPEGFTPLGYDTDVPSGVDPTQIPQTTADLEELTSSTYDLTVTRAGELKIPVVGDVSGSYNRRVVVYEWARFKRLYDAKRVEYQYGYVIRFCLTVSKWDATMKVGLPWLSAEAQLGNIEAQWLMQVRGLVGPEIDKVVLPPQELKVETFVIARQSLEAVVKAINDSSTHFKPGVLLSTVDPTAPETLYWLSAVRALATYYVSRGRSLNRAQSAMGSTDTAVRDMLTEVYSYFGITDPGQSPDGGARDKARSILHGIQADTGD